MRYDKEKGSEQKKKECTDMDSESSLSKASFLLWEDPPLKEKANCSK